MGIAELRVPPLFFSGIAHFVRWQRPGVLTMFVEYLRQLAGLHPLVPAILAAASMPMAAPRQAGSPDCFQDKFCDERDNWNERPGR
jgi:hypothetical protein